VIFRVDVAILLLPNKTNFCGQTAASAMNRSARPLQMRTAIPPTRMLSQRRAGRGMV
jgi:hypothetical protein